MIPSGRAIAAEFGVSIATAAKVATGLQALGLVTARPGAGTIVTAPGPPADRVQGSPVVVVLASRGGPPADEIAGYRPAWGEDWLSARPPTSAEAREFGIKHGSPILIAHSRRFDNGDQVLEYAELIARAEYLPAAR